MNKIHAIQVLRFWDQQKRYVFTHQDMRRLFPDDQAKAFTEGLSRLVKDGLLVHACRGVYVNPHANSYDGYVIEHIAKALKRGAYNYISLESMLVEYGAISQMLLDRLTVMTTGRKGTVKTPYGVIEFTHTNRSVEDILNSVVTVESRPLRLATLETAWRDLKRVGRNTDMVNVEVIHGE